MPDQREPREIAQRAMDNCCQGYALPTTLLRFQVALGVIACGRLLDLVRRNPRRLLPLRPMKGGPGA